MNVQVFYPAAELLMLTGITTNEVNTEIETQPVIAKAKISNCSKQFKYLRVFLHFSLTNFLSFER